MTTELTNNWNNVVSVEDKVFLLGDFSAYEKDANISICNRLNGNKHSLWVIMTRKMKNTIIPADLKV